MGPPIFDPKDVKNAPRTAQAVNAEACQRECHEAICAWPYCSCPAIAANEQRRLTWPEAA